MSTLTRAQAIALLEERDTLLEQIRQLKGALVPHAVLPVTWKLSKIEERLLRAIRAVGPNVLHHERAILALYDLWEDAPDKRILDVWVCKLRRRLQAAQAPVEIETVWGRGWRMTPEACAAYDAAVEAERARWDRPRRAA